MIRPREFSTAEPSFGGAPPTESRDMGRIGAARESSGGAR